MNIPSLIGTSAPLPIVGFENFTIEGEHSKTGELFLHLKGLKNWSKTTYFQILEGIKAIKDDAKDKGHTHVWVLIPDDIKLYKFELMLGFEVVEEIVINDEPMILMAQAV